MASFSQVFNNIKSSVYQKYSRDPALMMVHTGTIGWIMSSAAQLINIKQSDKFTPDEKKFLFPQEALDAVVNIGLFYGVTNSCKNLSSKLVSTGKLLSKGIRNYIKENPLPKGFDVSKLGDINTNLGKIYESDSKFFKMYQPFKNGVDLAVNTVACIVASNIITPIVRNKIASVRQKQEIAQDRAKTQIAQLSMSGNIVRKTDIDSTSVKPNVSAGMHFSGSLKI